VKFRSLLFRYVRGLFRFAVGFFFLRLERRRFHALEGLQENSRSMHPLDRSVRLYKGENTYSSDPGFSALLVRRL
jgi:hypothetical protein